MTNLLSVIVRRPLSHEPVFSVLLRFEMSVPLFRHRGFVEVDFSAQPICVVFQIVDQFEADAVLCELN